MARQHKGEPISEAAVHWQRAKEQWERAANDSYAPADPGSCVTWSFYAYENAVVAAAIALGEDWEEDHGKKKRLAKKLAERGHLKTDVSDLLDRLNGLRKDIAYGEPGSELANEDLEDLVRQLESFLSEVEAVIKKRGGRGI